MSNIQTVDVKAVKVKREAAEKQEKRAQNIEERRDTRFKVKAQKVQLNKNAQQFNPVAVEHQCSEFKVAPALMLVEAVARGVPAIAPADYERLKRRLLMSPDIQYLTEKIFMDYDVRSDKLKLLLTLITHSANEVLTTVTESRKNESKQLQEPETSELQAQTKKETKPSSPVFKAQESIKLETKD